MDFYASTITSFSIYTNVAWPIIALPNFEVRGVYIHDLARTVQVGLIPLVKEVSRSTYEEYARTDHDWLHEGLVVQRQDLTAMQSMPNVSSFIYHTVIGNDGEVTIQEKAIQSLVDFGPADYAPVWQMAPAPLNPAIINYDLFQNAVFRDVYKGMWETRTSQISPVVDLTFYLDSTDTEEVSHPHSFLLFPIYSQLFHEEDIDNLVGIVMATASWDKLFEEILPPGKLMSSTSSYT
jgi:hypothetical protein